MESREWQVCPIPILVNRGTVPTTVPGNGRCFIRSHSFLGPVMSVFRSRFTGKGGQRSRGVVKKNKRKKRLTRKEKSLTFNHPRQ